MTHELSPKKASGPEDMASQGAGADPGGIQHGRTKRLALAATFGVLLFLPKILLPSPIDKLSLIFQALFLTLGSLLLRGWGGTLVATVGGVLTAIWRAPLAPFTLGLAVLYGILVDLFLGLSKARASYELRLFRLMAAVGSATALVGLTSYYVTVFIFALLPRNPLLEATVLVGGTLSGTAGAYLAAVIWRKLFVARVIR